MIFSVVLGALLLLGLLGFWLMRWDDDGLAWFIGCSVIGLICFFFGALLPSMIAWVDQINDQEAIHQIQQKRAVYATKAQRLTDQFANYLEKEYPEHERHVFDAISPGNVAFYFAKYPELQASKTALALVAQVRDLNDSVYEQDLALAKVRKDIRVRQRNPFHIQFLVPNG